MACGSNIHKLRIVTGYCAFYWQIYVINLRAWLSIQHSDDKSRLLVLLGHSWHIVAFHSPSSANRKPAVNFERTVHSRAQQGRRATTGRDQGGRRVKLILLASHDRVAIRISHTFSHRRHSRHACIFAHAAARLSTMATSMMSPSCTRLAGKVRLLAGLLGDACQRTPQRSASS